MFTQQTTKSEIQSAVCASQKVSHDMSEPYLPPEDGGGGGVERNVGKEPGDLLVHVGKLFVAGGRC